ncbi:hypothetical protein LJR225_001012 [Phenylobacterium sp. LjRoot225]|uniref:hypothetical protein n=1 Tax=Phenylobacterium sp. LjRoot225 TaxID=3342285 RepID=UPI003ECD1E76
MDLDRLSPPNRELLMQALPDGRLVNVLYDGGARIEGGYARERRCFALGERGWLDFIGWEGRPKAGARCLSRWALTDEAQALLKPARARQRRGEADDRVVVAPGL